MNVRTKFENYITQNLDSVYRFAYVYTRNKEYAEDVVSESIVRALSSIWKIRNPEHMQTWFYRIIINTANTYLRKQQKLTPTDEVPEVGKEDDYSKISLEMMLNLLNDDLRVIVTLRYLEDMKISEIARVLSMNENTVKTRLYRALKILKIHCGDQEV